VDLNPARLITAAMKEFNCHYVDISLRIPEGEFDREAFWEDVKDNAHEQTDCYGWSFGSKTDPGEQHADIFLDFREKTRVRIQVKYHQAPREIKDIRPPYMEDCARWLGSFIASEIVRAQFHAMYLFDGEYKTTLDFPALTKSVGRQDVKVNGVSLLFDEYKAWATLHEDDGVSVLHLEVKAKSVDLKRFNLRQQLCEWVPLVDSLVVRNEEEHI
jgi:hypothetical protein